MTGGAEPEADDGDDRAAGRAHLDTTWADAQIGYLLRRASAVMAADYAAAAGANDMRPVLVTMLSVIADNPGVTQSDVGAALGIQRANAVPLVAELTDRGLVDRRRSWDDRRRIELHVTEAGREALERGRAMIDAHESRMTGSLSATELATMRAMLARIIASARSADDAEA